jgi:hypothetical protein
MDNVVPVSGETSDYWQLGVGCFLLNLFGRVIDELHCGQIEVSVIKIDCIFGDSRLLSNNG